MKKYKKLLSVIPKECHWVLCDQNILRSMHLGVPVQRKLKGNIFKKLLYTFRFEFFRYFIIALFGFLEISRLWFRQSNKNKILNKNNFPIKEPIKIFLTCNIFVLSEIYNNYCKLSSEKVIKVVQDDISSMSSIYHVNFFSLLKYFRKSFSTIKILQQNILFEFNNYRLELLTSAARRIALYSFTRTFWEGMKETFNVLEVNLLNADISAYAAIDAGLNTKFQLHGLLSYSVLVGNFNNISLLSRSEARYIETLPVNCSIEHRKPILPQDFISRELTKTIVLVSDLVTEEDLSMYLEAIYYFNTLNYKIVIKTKAKTGLLNSQEYWKKIINKHKFKTVSIDVDCSFEILIKDLRPKFVLAQSSTVLVDSLYLGIIPITFCKEDDIEIKDTVYPLLYSCLRWDIDQNRIKEMSLGKLDYNSVLKVLLNNELIYEYH